MGIAMLGGVFSSLCLAAMPHIKHRLFRYEMLVTALFMTDWMVRKSYGLYRGDDVSGNW